MLGLPGFRHGRRSAVPRCSRRSRCRLFTALLTAFYMFRLWFLAFTGTPRNPHVYSHAHESPGTMVVPLVILAACSLGVAWGWPLWDAEASFLGHKLHEGEPTLAGSQFTEARHLAEEHHLAAGGLALLTAVLGAGYAWSRYGKQAPNAEQLKEPSGFFANKWKFDELYDFAFLRGTLQLAKQSARADRRDPESPRRFTLDGAMSGWATLAERAGLGFRWTQTGQVRQYVLVLALTIIGLIGMLTVFAR